MKDEIKEIRDYIACPQLGDDYYGEWGALRLDQRLKIKSLLDYITNLQAIEQQYSAILSENAELENKYNKALHILADYSMPCELDDFNLPDTDYCETHCSNDDEQFPKCWDEYIEWSLKDD